MEFTVGDYDNVEVYFEINGKEVGHTDYLEDGSHHYQITELDSNTVYQFTAVLEYNGETIHGETLDFKTEPKPDYLEIEPSASTIEAGESQDYVAFLYYEDGSDEDVTEETIWSDNIDQSEWVDNEVITESAGDWEITGEYEGFKNTVSLHVEPTDVEYVLIDPDEDQTIETGEIIDFSAEAYDEYDNLITDVALDFTWENTDDSGHFDETEAGEYPVTAKYEDVASESIIVTVLAEYFEVEITDADGEIEKGDTVTIEFTVTNTGDVEGTQEIVFSVDDEEVDMVEMTIETDEIEEGEFTWDADDIGEFYLEVASDDSFDLVTVTVDEEEDGFLDIPGFTIVLLILGVVIAITINYKKEQ